MDFVEIAGVHGTLKENKESILEHGFWIRPGRRGAGVYFWEKCPIWKELAIYWIKVKNKDKGNILLMYSLLKANQKHFVDFTLNSNEDILKRFRDRLYRTDNAMETSEIWDLLIAHMEQNEGVSIKLYRARCPPPVFLPDKIHKYQLALGEPVCLIARDNSIIQIERFEEVSQ